MLETGIAPGALVVECIFTSWPRMGPAKYGKEVLLVKIVLRERETVQDAVRRFRKLVERTGLKRELRRRERYEKPSDVRRKAKARSVRRSKKLARG